MNEKINMNSFSTFDSRNETNKSLSSFNQSLPPSAFDSLTLEKVSISRLNISDENINNQDNAKAFIYKKKEDGEAIDIGCDFDYNDGGYVLVSRSNMIMEAFMNYNKTEVMELFQPSIEASKTNTFDVNFISKFKKSNSNSPSRQSTKSLKNAILKSNENTIYIPIGFESKGSLNLRKQLKPTIIDLNCDETNVWRGEDTNLSEIKNNSYYEGTESIKNLNNSDTLENITEMLQEDNISSPQQNPPSLSLSPSPSPSPEKHPTNHTQAQPVSSPDTNTTQTKTQPTEENKGIHEDKNNEKKEKKPTLASVFSSFFMNTLSEAKTEPTPVAPSPLSSLLDNYDTPYETIQQRQKQNLISILRNVGFSASREEEASPLFDDSPFDMDLYKMDDVPPVPQQKKKTAKKKKKKVIVRKKKKTKPLIIKQNENGNRKLENGKTRNKTGNVKVLKEEAAGKEECDSGIQMDPFHHRGNSFGISSHKKPVSNGKIVRI